MRGGMLAAVGVALFASAGQAAGPDAVAVAQTVGLLELPAAAERRADGGVWFTTEVGDPGWVGTRRWLRLAPTRDREQWRQRTRVDIRPEPAVLESVAAGNRFVEPVFGWRDVSALETLAASRGGQAIRVALDDVRPTPERGGMVLSIAEPPTEVSGTHRILVQFVRTDDCRRGRVVVRSWNIAAGAFVDETRGLAYAPAQPRGAAAGPMTSLCGIERSSSNAQGYMAFGVFDAQHRFVIRAVLPRALFDDADTQTLRQGRSDYFEDKNFSDIGRVRIGVRTTRMTDQGWPVGTEGLVVHVYGNTDGKDGDPALWRRLSAGHFSLGFFTVRTDPLTGAAVPFVVYTQLYGGNPDGILSGRVARHAYLGDLTRGVMFRRAVSDVLIGFADSQAVRIDNWTRDAWALWRYELDVMAARYRSGDGVGGVIIGPASSCVQDATQATYVTIHRWRREVEQHPKVVAARRQGTHPATLSRIAGWTARFAALEKRVVSWGKLRRDWSKNARLFVAARQSNAFAAIDGPRAVLSALTMTPRSGHDRLGELFVSRGDEVVVQRMNLEGGFIPDIAPLAPKSILRR